jgi:hypothetical protein
VITLTCFMTTFFYPKRPKIFKRRQVGLTGARANRAPVED